MLRHKHQQAIVKKRMNPSHGFILSYRIQAMQPHHFTIL